MNTIDFPTLLATALERAAFSQPGPDGGLKPEDAADVAAILNYEEPEGPDDPGGSPSEQGARGEESARAFERALAYAWDEQSHPREAEAHDDKKPGEFAPGRQGGEEGADDDDDDPEEAARSKEEYDAALEAWGKAHDAWAAKDDLHRDLPEPPAPPDPAEKERLRAEFQRLGGDAHARTGPVAAARMAILWHEQEERAHEADLERRADSSAYRAALKEYHAELGAARDAFLKDELEPWKEAAQAYDQYERDKEAWDGREAEREARKEALDEADPIGAAEKAVEATWEASPAPDWDLDQEDPVGHFRAQVTAFAESFAKGWDEHFGTEGPVRAAMKELGVDDKGLAKFDRAAARGRAALEKAAPKYKAAADKYLDYQARADEAKAKFEEMAEPEEPDEPTLDEPDEPDRDDFETDEEYDAAQSAYGDEKKAFDDAWDEHEKASAAYDKAKAAYDKAGTKAEAMETQAEKLASRMDEDKESLEAEWDSGLKALKEQQEDAEEKLAAAIKKEAEDDEEPDEPDAPGDEPEFEPDLEAPDPAEYGVDGEPPVVYIKDAGGLCL